MTLIHSPKGELLGGRYYLIRQIGLGGTSKVYEAVHHLTQERVAIKVIPLNELKSDSRTVARFMREAKLPQEVSHKGIVRINDAWIDDQQRCCLVMEYLNGVNLRQAIRSGQMTRLDLLRWLIRILEPLEVAHRSGVIHRDLKPENIFLHMPLPAESDTMVADDMYRFDEESGEVKLVHQVRTSKSPRHLPSSLPPEQQENFQSSVPTPIESLLGENFDITQVKLLDFGLSRTLMEPSVTQTGHFVGTPWYMSPEQVFSPKTVTHQTDLWSMGIMLYEMLCNTVPFSGNSLPMVCNAIKDDPIDLSVITNEYPKLQPLADTILLCLQRDLKQRIKSAAELKYRLEADYKSFSNCIYASETVVGEMYPTPSTQISVEGLAKLKEDSTEARPNYNQELHLSESPLPQAPQGSKAPQGSQEDISDMSFNSEDFELSEADAPATLRLSAEDIKDQMKELRSLVGSDTQAFMDTLGSSTTSDDGFSDYPLCDISIVSSEIADLPTIVTKERSPFAKQSYSPSSELLNPEKIDHNKVKAQAKPLISSLSAENTFPNEALEKHQSPVLLLSDPPNAVPEEIETQQILKLYKKKKKRADLWVLISLFIFGISVGLLIRAFKLL